MFENITKIISKNDDISVCFLSSLASFFIEIGIFIGYLICSENIVFRQTCNLITIIIITFVFIYLQYKASLFYIKTYYKD